MISPRLAVAATVLTVAIAVPSAIAAQAATATTVQSTSLHAVVAHPAKATSFANCTTLHKTYKAGVAKPGTRYNIVHHAGKPDEKRKITGKPTFDSALYSANSKLDADKDGIACELS